MEYIQGRIVQLELAIVRWRAKNSQSDTGAAAELRDYKKELEITKKALQIFRNTGKILKPGVAAAAVAAAVAPAAPAAPSTL